MANRIPRVPVREQDPAVRAHNFDEVCYGYDMQEALLEASRCLHCKNPRCVAACPVGLKIPDFIARLAQGDVEGAARIIAEDSSLPAVCGRVCPQETQCEGSCVLGVKGEPVAIGKLERFVADHTAATADAAQPIASQSDAQPAAAQSVVATAARSEAVGVPSNGHKVAVVGSGPAGLACAADLAKWGYDVTIFEALHRPGGVLEYGIPEFRLPKDKVLRREIDSVLALGVKIETDVVVGRTLTIDRMLDEMGFEAVFIGTGAGLPRFTYTLNYGGRRITQRISGFVHCSMQEAESIKNKLDLRCSPEDEEVILYRAPLEEGGKKYSKLELSKMVYHEIRSLNLTIGKKLFEAGWYKSVNGAPCNTLTGGIVLTGGTSLLLGITELFSAMPGPLAYTFSTRLGRSRYTGDACIGLNSPKESAAMGLIAYEALRFKEGDEDEEETAASDDSLWAKTKRFLIEFFIGQY